MNECIFRVAHPIAYPFQSTRRDARVGMPRRTFNGHDKKIVAARQAWRCAGCHSLFDETFHVDHIAPLWSGGADELSNAQALCVACHAKKTTAEEAERLRRSRARKAAGRHASLSCCACGAVLSPYFAITHQCGR